MFRHGKSCTAFESKPKKMFLTDDDRIRAVVSTRESEFRLRIWRANGFPPLVLVSQVEGGCPPNWDTHRLATRAARRVLMHPHLSRELIYLEAYEREGKPRLLAYNIEWTGPSIRPRATNAISTPMAWGELHDMVGEIVLM